MTDKEAFEIVLARAEVHIMENDLDDKETFKDTWGAVLQMQKYEDDFPKKLENTCELD
ncbi:MAG: hypothetical protein H8E05_00105 [Bacteroidetes bacterium]|nr:hypothetical protein [Bacteroidota bacterium]